MRRSQSISVLLLAIATLSNSCVDHPAGPSNDLTVAVAKCAPAASAFISQTIGIGGGTIAIGNNKLVVPAGALASSVAISMEILADSSRSVLFQPEGLTFAAGKPATLTLSYAECTPPSAALRAIHSNGGGHGHGQWGDGHWGHHHGDDDDGDSLSTTTQVAYTTDDLQILELLQSVDDPEAKEVSAELPHFSRYAVAW
jgi:hypothetical protein